VTPSAAVAAATALPVATAAAAATAASGAGLSSRLAPPAVPPKLQAAAMSRLSSVLDGASGSDFLTFVGAAAAAAGAAAAGHRAGSSASSRCSGSSGISGFGAVIGLLLQHMSVAATDAQQQLSEGDGVRRSLLADARQVRCSDLDVSVCCFPKPLAATPPPAAMPCSAS
jgi:hypothetical protein